MGETRIDDAPSMSIVADRSFDPKHEIGFGRDDSVGIEPRLGLEAIEGNTLSLVQSGPICHADYNLRELAGDKAPFQQARG
jgi:hypothetical protein